MSCKELSKYMTNASDKSLTLGEFRELTKDIPDDTVLSILTPNADKIYEAGRRHRKCNCDNAHEYLVSADYTQIMYYKDNNCLFTTTVCKDLSPNVNKNMEFLFKRFLHDYEED